MSVYTLMSGLESRKTEEGFALFNRLVSGLKFQTLVEIFSAEEAATQVTSTGKTVEATLAELAEARAAARVALAKAKHTRRFGAAKAGRSASRNARRVRAGKLYGGRKAATKGFSLGMIAQAKANLKAVKAAFTKAQSSVEAATATLAKAILKDDVKVIRSLTKEVQRKSHALRVRAVELKFAKEMVAIVAA